MVGNMNNKVETTVEQTDCNKNNDQKKSVFKKFCKSFVGLFNFNFDNSINYEGDSEYAALLKRRDELRDYKMTFGYNEEKQKELESINKRLVEYIKK